MNFVWQLTQNKPWQPYNKDHHWFFSGDSQEAWQKNMQDPEKRQYLESQGWHLEHAIKYRINKDGFRGPPLVSKAGNILALGCSFTFGIGIREDQTWPSILAANLGLAFNNLGWPGASADTCFRQAEYWIPNLQPRYVIVLTPPAARFEIILSDPGPARTWMPCAQDHDASVKTWMSVEENHRINCLKNQMALQHLCGLFGIPCFIYDSQDVLDQHGPNHRIQGQARDMAHPGPAFMQSFAQQVAEEITNAGH